MLKPLFLVIGGITGTGFFGTWGIASAVNNSYYKDGFEWFRQGVDFVIGKSNRTKGLALKIPNNEFQLNCSSLKNGRLDNGCEAVKNKLDEVKRVIKNSGEGLNINNGNINMMTDGQCGIIAWDDSKDDYQTNLAKISKLLIRAHCFKAKEKSKGEEFNSEFIQAFNRITDSVQENKFVGALFNSYTEGREKGKTLSKNDIKTNLAKLVTDNTENLRKWADTLSEIVSDKFVLRVDSELANEGGKKWLSLQKINQT